MPDKNSPTPDSVLHSILARASNLRDRIALALSVSDRSGSQTNAFSLVSRRLETTVVRPLRGALAEMRATQESELNVRTASASRPDDWQPVLSLTALDDELWALAKDATALQVNAKIPTQTKEAAAGLQYLACELVTISDGANGKGSIAARLSELKAMQAELSTGIQAESNGPYLVTQGERLLNWLGEPIPLCPLTALCRCGQSATNPFCDGAHAKSDFTGQKDAKHVPDRRDTYVGEQATILDNRGTCAHSGFCTDRLSTVFRLGKEPFVAPSGGRLDDIVHAVRACPSGALSFAIEGREAREQVD